MLWISVCGEVGRFYALVPFSYSFNATDYQLIGRVIFGV
jgi:hypothetical protein